MTPKEREQACKNLNIASNDQINRLEGEFTQLRGDMATVSSDVASAVANANSALASASAATTAAQAAIDSITGYATDLATVSSKADTNSGNITTLSSDISTLSANVGAISGKNTSQDTKIGELSSSVAGLTNSAVYHEAVINNLTTAWTAYSADLKNDFDTFSAAEDAVITAATAAIPGQVSTEVSGQLSGKQDKLTPGVNISLTTAGVIDVKNQNGYATNYSVALGNGCSAVGQWAFAHGYNTLASGTYSYSHAEGASTSAYGNNSHAEGNRTIANNDNSHAEGSGTSALSPIAHSEGFATLARGTYSHAEGRNTITSAQGSHAEGQSTSAIGDYSHAEGNYVVANALHTHAEGASTSAMKQYSHVEGRYTISDTVGQHVEGQYNAPATGALHVIGNGTSTADRSNIVETFPSGVNVNGNLNVASYDINRQLGDVGTILANYEYDKVSRSIMISNNNVSVNTPFSDYPLYSLGDYSIYEGPTYINSPVSYLNLSDSNGRAVAIEKWKGDLHRILYYGNGNYNKVSAWPSVLPVNITNLQRFAGNNPYITDVSAQFTNLSSKVNISKNYMFQGCINITADIVPIMDTFRAEDASRHVGMFRGCTAVPNYSTLTADPTYSAFF